MTWLALLTLHDVKQWPDFRWVFLATYQPLGRPCWHCSDDTITSFTTTDLCTRKMLLITWLCWHLSADVITFINTDSCTTSIMSSSYSRQTRSNGPVPKKLASCIEIFEISHHNQHYCLHCPVCHQVSLIYFFSTNVFGISFFGYVIYSTADAYCCQCMPSEE